MPGPAAGHPIASYPNHPSLRGLALPTERASSGFLVLSGEPPARAATSEPRSPDVSVIVPCWNRVTTIDRALSSILDEREVALEVVVVDDGSTDGTAEAVRRIAERDPRVVLLVSPENEGPSAARNRALPAVRGQWLAFVDADDRLPPGALAALYRAATATDALAVIGQRLWSDGVRTWITHLYDQPDIRAPGRKSLARNPGLLYYAAPTGKLFHRSCWQGLTFEGRILGDQPWTLRALLRAGDRIEVIADDVYVWLRPPEGSDFVTITATRHGSPVVAAEAVRVAIGALRAVADEADRSLADPADRETVVAAYFDRLVRADTAGALARAAQSGDPAAATLFEAVTAYLRAAPPAVVGRSRATVPWLLLPPVAYWRQLPVSARAAYWSMVGAVARPQRDARDGPSPVARAGVWVLVRAGRRWRRPGSRPAVDALLGLASVAGAALVALWKRVRGRP
jgi:hypothetical protein